jgi:endonuclease/exonuclease/phosphatase family metal-dependent hydrolase
MTDRIAILSWNIQYGLGVDGRVDLARIAATCRALGDADMLCLQEVSVGFGELAPAAEVDQVAALAGLFPGYEPVFVPAIDRPGVPSRRRFGNLILSRLPVLDVVAHALPRPAEPAVMTMQRHALEATVAAGGGALRVVTTHLEFHSLAQRGAQAERLGALGAEWRARDAAPSPAGKGPYAALPPMHGTVLCGDFNFPLDEPSYAALTGPAAGFVDAWPALHGTAAHAPTCGVHDRHQWPQGAHARDFVFVSASLAPHLRALAVDTETGASDHQPLLLTLGGLAAAGGRA